MDTTGIIVGLDIGEARTGIARSDALQMLAFPVSVVRGKNEDEMVREVSAAIKALSPVRVVAGLPLNQHGEPGAQARRVLAMIERLKEATGLPFVTQDERFSTAEANRVARDMETGGKKRKGKVDKIAATLILQTRLDREAALRRQQP